MEKIKLHQIKVILGKNIKFVFLVVILIVGSMFYYVQNDNKAIKEFANSYKEFEDSSTKYYSQVLIQNFEDLPDMKRFSETYSLIAKSLTNSLSSRSRLELAKSAMRLNDSMISNLDNNGQLYDKASSALYKLNRNASSIKSDQIREKALEIADLAGKELQSESDYDMALKDKKELIKKSLQTIIDDDGGVNGFLDFLNNKENQVKVESQNSDFDKLSKLYSDIINNRLTAYARFQGLVGIKG